MSLCSSVHVADESSMKIGTYDDDGSRATGNATKARVRRMPVSSNLAVSIYGVEVSRPATGPVYVFRPIG